MATPAFSTLLSLGAFPSPEITILSLLTAFAGYTAVYALNDVTDYRVDREKTRSSKLPETHQDLDSVFVRHPLAQGMLPYWEGLFWLAAWAGLAMVGSYLLNPFCTVIFLVPSFLEYIYCSLLKISHLRGVISGWVKTSGPIAAVFAVDPDPEPLFLIVLFLWLFFWEIGGQNVPNDWADGFCPRKLGFPIGLELYSRVPIPFFCLATGFTKRRPPKRPFTCLTAPAIIPWLCFSSP